MESTLDVKAKTAYFNTLKYFLIIVFSLTFAFPWAFCRYHSWLIENSTLNGKKLVFDGKTKHLYLIYLSGIIIGVIAYFLYFGIVTAILKIMIHYNVNIDYKLIVSYAKYILSILPSVLVALLITSRFYKYRSIHTHFEGYSNTTSGIRLDIVKMLLSSIIYKAIILVTNIIGYPFALKIKESIFVSRRFVDGNDLKFNGTFRRICFIWFTGIILSIITIFIYIPYFFFRLNRYIITNTTLKNNNIEASID